MGTGEALARVNTVKLVEAENHTIGMCHELILKSLGGDVIPGAIGRAFPPGESLPDALEGIFGKTVDIVVFGYTHVLGWVAPIMFQVIEIRRHNRAAI